MRFTISLIVAFAVGLPLACSPRQSQIRANAQTASDPSSILGANENKNSKSPGTLPLRTLSDVPLSCSATRLDYQRLDSEKGGLYITHLVSNRITVFDVPKPTALHDLLHF